MFTSTYTCLQTSMHIDAPNLFSYIYSLHTVYIFTYFHTPIPIHVYILLPLHVYKHIRPYIKTDLRNSMLIYLYMIIYFTSIYPYMLTYFYDHACPINVYILLSPFKPNTCLHTPTAIYALYMFSYFYAHTDSCLHTSMAIYAIYIFTYFYAHIHIQVYIILLPTTPYTCLHTSPPIYRDMVTYI
jgi:hypothetical protein